MPVDNTTFNNQLSPAEMAKTRNQADFINQKHKAEGKSYGESLGKDSFLKLLVTELTHQDPTAPMQDKEFIAQMAQFSSLEQMNNVNTQMKELNSRGMVNEAYSLIGKRVQAFDATRGVPVDGTVSHVVRRQGEVRVVVDKYECRLDDVHAVFSQPAPEVRPAPVQQTELPTRPAAVQQVTDTETPAIETDLSQVQSEKGVRNSFNDFYNYYDNKSNEYNKAKESYSAY
ncbi:MAG: hypothetical protein PF637_14075 [Spirochaetes bacterium]|jgi:flagellar basal-body rod modification protein FlgD|nr:hypothetical protein [Spirochaetota bacterium]